LPGKKRTEGFEDGGEEDGGLEAGAGGEVGRKMRGKETGTDPISGRL